VNHGLYAIDHSWLDIEKSLTSLGLARSPLRQDALLEATAATHIRHYPKFVGQYARSLRAIPLRCIDGLTNLNASHRDGYMELHFVDMVPLTTDIRKGDLDKLRDAATVGTDSFGDPVGTPEQAPDTRIAVLSSRWPGHRGC
jgi:hypothetical protein